MRSFKMLLKVKISRVHCVVELVSNQRRVYVGPMFCDVTVLYKVVMT